MHIRMEVLDAAEVREHNLKEISIKGMFLEPGEVAVMRLDGNPIIIAFSDNKMMVTRAESLDVVETIICAFENHGVLLPALRMSVQIYTPGTECRFVEKAHKEGIRHVWSVLSIPELLLLAARPICKEPFVAVRREY